MRDERGPEEDSTVGIGGVPWRVTRVKVTGPYVLHVHFVDGVDGEVDLSRLILSEDAGVFARLRDVKLFNQVYVDAGAVAWPGELDLAPDAMHDGIQQFGRYTA
jgi:hypothetical protein